ncbi:MAG: ATP-grasp domain-containing protein [Oscillospiraceae bacterium]
MTDFIPVLLGSDATVYGMARAFHQQYNVNPIAVSKTILTACCNTKIINFVLEPNLEDSDTFLSTMINVANQHKDKKLLLVPCGDGYVKLAVKFQEKLKEYYSLNLPNQEVYDMLSIKENFYKVCDKYGFSYPQTEVITFENYKEKEISLKFPVIIKAANSVEYWKCTFKGKMKVFVAQDKSEFDRILQAIYSSTYKDHLTIQEFIPGDDSYMRVLNCYIGKDGKVKLMALGHALLEEHTPQGIGSYMAIINTYDEELLKKFKAFLEDIGYTGFANFDMKYDYRDGKYKLFETNLRMGRSSFYVTASGYNLSKWIVEDVIENKPLDLTIAKDKALWLQVPKGILTKYVQNPEALQLAKQLIKEKKCQNTLYYKKDMSLKRFIVFKLNMLNHYRKYKKYFGKKGLSE